MCPDSGRPGEVLSPSDYEFAVSALDAVNLSGVVHGFVEAVRKIRSDPNADTDYVNRHPVSQLYAFAVARIALGEDAAPFPYDAYRFCVQAAESGKDRDRPEEADCGREIG